MPTKRRILALLVAIAIVGLATAPTATAGGGTKPPKPSAGAWGLYDDTPDLTLITDWSATSTTGPIDHRSGMALHFDAASLSKTAVQLRVTYPTWYVPYNFYDATTNGNVTWSSGGGSCDAGNATPDVAWVWNQFTMTIPTNCRGSATLDFMVDARSFATADTFGVPKVRINVGTVKRPSWIDLAYDATLGADTLTVHKAGWAPTCYDGSGTLPDIYVDLAPGTYHNTSYYDSSTNGTCSGSVTRYHVQTVVYATDFANSQDVCHAAGVSYMNLYTDSLNNAGYASAPNNMYKCENPLP